ncbi:MAG: hypothetical protein ACOC56_05525 [Atribacterota bacterium]
MILIPKFNSDKNIVFYCAYGKKHREECIISLNSLKDHCSDIKVVIYTDNASHISNECPLNKKDEICENEIDVGDKWKNIYKVTSLIHYIDKKESVFNILFLDTDTMVVSNLQKIFKALEFADFAAAHANQRFGSGKRKKQIRKVPQIFPQYNTGVMLMKTTEEIFAFLKLWQFYYLEKYKVFSKFDQPMFRFAAYDSKLLIYTLTSECNLRTISHMTKVSDEVFILHDRNLRRKKYREAIITDINSKLCERYWNKKEIKWYKKGIDY